MPQTKPWQLFGRARSSSMFNILPTRLYNEGNICAEWSVAYVESNSEHHILQEPKTPKQCQVWTAMPPTAMCSLCPRKKPLPKKLVRFDSVVDTFSISECNSGTASRVSTSSYLYVPFP